MDKNNSQQESMFDVVFDSIDQELKLRNLSRRDLAKHLEVPESSLSTAFARKSISFFQKDMRLERTADFLNIPTWALLSGHYFQNIEIKDGELMYSGEHPMSLLSPKALASLVRDQAMSTIVDMILCENASWPFIEAVGDAFQAASINQDNQYHAAMHKAHMLLDVFMDKMKNEF